MAEHIDQEIEAIKVVLLALEPLTAEVRTSVLGYVAKRLQIAIPAAQPSEPSTKAAPSAGTMPGAVDAGTELQATPAHIKDFRV